MIDIRKNCKYRHDNGNCLKVGGFCLAVDDEHCEMVLAIKALQEKERKHGLWKYFDYDNSYYCTVCGEIWTLNDGTP